MVAKQHPRDFLELLHKEPWFAYLPPAFASQLVDGGHIRHYADKRPVFLRQSPACGLYAVLEGAVRVVALTEGAREALLAFLEPVQWFGEISLFDELPRTHDAIAHGSATVLHIPQGTMLEILNANPAYWRLIGLLMGFKLRLAFNGMEDMAVLPAAPRLMRRLVLMAETLVGQSAPQGTFQIGIQQEQLALMLSVSRQTVNQILKDLEAQGMIHLAYGRIDILDLDKLRDLAKLPDAQDSLLLRISRNASISERRLLA